MLPESPYALIREMLETPAVLRRFDPAALADWRGAIAARGRLLVTGEGSSRIFPAKNAASLALQRGLPLQVLAEGARQAAEYDLGGFAVLAVSNSGRTRELIALCERLARLGVAVYAVTAAAGSPLTTLAADARVLACGPEAAIAATKTVVEQALLVQAVLGGDEWKDLPRAADGCAAVLAQAVPPEILDAAAAAPLLYFAGRNNGVAEELALKTNEITRQKSAYLEGTYALHGVEEVMRREETLVLVEPFRDEIEKYQSVLQKGVGLNIVAIASFDTPFPTIRIPALAGFDGYLQLLAGWNLLAAAGIARGVDIDKPERVRKAGNAL